MIIRSMASADVAGVATRSLAVLPIGSIEQHTLHLPVGTDALVAEALAARLEAERPEEVLLLPTLWYGASEHHTAYSGTASIGSHLLSAVLVAIIESLNRSSGMNRFLILNGHGGNEPGMRVALETLKRMSPGVLAWATNYWGPLFDQFAIEEGAPVRNMDHAGLIETSLLLALEPQNVSSIRRGPDVDMASIRPWLYEGRGFDQLTLHGGTGDPTEATADFGEQLLHAGVEGLCALVDLLLDIDR